MEASVTQTMSQLIERFQSLNVLVIGDAMLDSYLAGMAGALCREAPVPIVTIEDRVDMPGGAANAAVNAASLGAQVTLLSVIGEDTEGRTLRRLLERHGVSCEHLLARPERQTLAKHRVLAAAQLLLRFDQGSTAAVAQPIEQALIARLGELFS